MNDKLFSRISREKLEHYLDGTLNDTETAEIDRLLDEDADLQLLVDEYVSVQMQINNESLDKPCQDKLLRNNKRLWIVVSAAACCAALIAISVILISRPDNVVIQPEDKPLFRGSDTVFDADTDTVATIENDSL